MLEKSSEGGRKDIIFRVTLCPDTHYYEDAFWKQRKVTLKWNSPPNILKRIYKEN